MATVPLTLVEQPLQDGTKQLKLTSPYHPDLPSRARAIGGRWNSLTKTWRFDVRDARRVRDLCLQIYGQDPLAEPDEAPELLTVRLDLDRFERGQDLWLFGREICTRPGRDYTVRLGQGVILLSGGFPSYGGSMRHPELAPNDGTLLEVRDVPKPLVDDLLAGWMGQGDTPALVIVDAPSAEPAPTARDQILALWKTLDPTGQRSTLASLLGALGTAERAKALAELDQYRAQGAL